MKKSIKKKLDQNFFYHSFPRPGKSESEEVLIDRGLNILNSIVDYGILLTPESIEWEEPLSDGTPGNKMISITKSCSFTEIPSKKLSTHSNKFGQFSIEFDIEVLRKLGAIPVFYLPRTCKGDDTLESLASSLMVRVGEIQELLNNLRELEKWAEENSNKINYYPNLIIGGQEAVIGRCSPSAIADVIAFCKGPSQPIRIMRNALRVITGFFYQAEDYRYTKMMDYYKQREWRIVANMSFHGNELTHPIENDTLKKKISSINPDFFQKEIELHHGKRSRRVDLCQLFPGFGNKTFIEYAKKVIVPSKVLNQAKEILSKCNKPPKVVDLETVISKGK